MSAMPGTLVLAATLPLAACDNGNPLLTPVAWWHDLSGGAIAENRPPPPGADLPYPHIYTIPPKPVPPSVAFRTTVETQLAQERDDQERLAARSPIVVENVPPPKPVSAPPASPPDAHDAQPETANATLPGADAPAAKATPSPPAASSTQPDSSVLIIAGLPPGEANLPIVPDAPPPPPTFEGYAAQPAPSGSPPLPAHVPLSATGSEIFFAPGSATIDASQQITIKTIANRRGRGAIEVEGHGQSPSDTPGRQEEALALGLQRAQAVAQALEAQRVPASAIRISATAFGLGASLRVAS